MELTESERRMYDALNRHYDSRFDYTTSLRQYYGKRVMFFHLKSGLIDVVVSDSRCNEIGRARINERAFASKPEENNDAVNWACKLAGVEMK